MKEEQATAESSSECSNLHGGGGRDRSAIQVEENQEENKVRGAKRQLVLTTSSNTTLHPDSKGKAASCSFIFSHQF